MLFGVGSAVDFLVFSRSPFEFIGEELPLHMVARLKFYLVSGFLVS